MLFELPDDDVLYEALLQRDTSYEGRAFVTVSSTGIFCRLSCPARKPKRENCTFYPDAVSCVSAGFRPCKRCHPISHAEPAVQELLAALQANPERRWTESDLVALGHDPSTLRRSFKRAFGTTFLEMARQVRLGASFNALSVGASVIEAQLTAGFESGSAFREAFAKQIGVAPSAFVKDAMLLADWLETPLGPMVAVSDQKTLHLLEFFDRKALPTEMKKIFAAARGSVGFGRPKPTEETAKALDRFFAGKSAGFDVPLTLHGTEFTKMVWRELQKIPAGETRSYGEVAQQIGQPTATRAVARANGANQIAILVPCHRVIGADGSLTGYGGGLWRKQKLIETELQYGGTT